jgi:early secretory antigenic target protein ESAT-6
MELDGLKVVHVGLDRAADDLLGVVDSIDRRLEQLEQELRPLRTAWVGEAQLAYAVAKQRWDAAIIEMRDLLRETSHQVSRSNSSYRAADARGARAFEL